MLEKLRALRFMQYSIEEETMPDGLHFLSRRPVVRAMKIRTRDRLDTLEGFQWCLALRRCA